MYVPLLVASMKLAAKRYENLPTVLVVFKIVVFKRAWRGWGLLRGGAWFKETCLKKPERY